MIRPFTRVRLKRGVRSVCGWRGTATYLPDGRALKDGARKWWDAIDACDHEWSIMRDQTPYPGHPKTVEEWEAME